MILFTIKKVSLPRAGQFVSSALVLIVLTAVLMLFVQKLFNQLHVWAFPDDHQWFFYYEDSLMSTMMKAPVIFAYIAIIWLYLLS